MSNFSGRSLGSANTYEELWYAYFADQTAVDYSYELKPFYPFRELGPLLGLISNIGILDIVQLVPQIGHMHYESIEDDYMPADYYKSYISDLEIAEGTNIIFSILVTLDAKNVWDSDFMRSYLNDLNYLATPGHEDVLAGVGYNRAVLGHYIISWGDRLDVSTVQDSDCIAVLFYKVGEKRRINVSVNQMILSQYIISNGFLRFVGINRRDNSRVFDLEYIDTAAFASYLSGLITDGNIKVHIVVHYSNLDKYSGEPLVVETNDSSGNLYYPDSRCIVLNSDFLNNNLIHCIPARFTVYFVHRPDLQSYSAVIGGWPSIPYFVPRLNIREMPRLIKNTYYKMQIIHLFNMVHSFNHVPSMNMNLYETGDLGAYIHAFNYDGIDCLTSPLEYYKVYIPDLYDTPTMNTIISKDSGNNRINAILSMIQDGEISSKKVVDYAKLVKPIFIMNKNADIHANYRYNVLYRDNLSSLFWRHLMYDEILLDEKGIGVSEIIMNTTTEQIWRKVRDNSDNIIYGGITHVNFYTAYPFLIFYIFEDRPYLTPFSDRYGINSIFVDIPNSHYPIFISLSGNDGGSDLGQEPI